MDGMFENAEGGRGPFEQFDLSRFPNCWSQSQANDFLFFTAPETGHQQDASANASFAKGNCLIERSHAEPVRSFLLECPRALDRAVAVGISFHDGANRDPRTYVSLYGAKILPQGSQRYLSPGRPSRGSLGNFDSGHFL